MSKRNALLMLTFLLSSLMIFNASIDARFIGSVKASSTTIIVPSVGYPTIQEAIDKANASDTIIVTPGRYHEHITIAKPIKLKGENPATTIIDGDEENKTIVNIIASNVEIRGFTIENGSKYYPGYGYGIQMMHNVSVTIRNNIIKDISVGIFLSNSSSCDIIDNTIMDNIFYGIQLSDSSFNRIIGNNIENNPGGIYITSVKSQANKLYHNNFLYNTDHAPLPRGNATEWDNGAEGNYWSDYYGSDADGDGIGDDPYPEGFPPELALDKYPLIELWSVFRTHNVPWNGQTYNVTTYCNSTVASFNFSQPEKQISFNVTGPSGAASLCNVTIPKILLNASSNGWIVLVDDENATGFLVGENDTHTSIYFTISLSTHNVKIIGTDAIPEFPTVLLFPIFMIATLISIVFVKRRNRMNFGRRFRG